MEILKRSLIMFIILYLIVKLLGKKQIKSLTLYDYVLSITIGSITADTIISIDTPLTDGIIALSIFGIIGIILSLITSHNHPAEEIVDGEPLVLFENDNFNYQNLETAKISIAKLLEHCRLKNCFDINELGCAILEPSGDISVLLKENYKPITSSDLKQDIKKNTKKQTYHYEIIVDGSLNESELKRAKRSKIWLNTYLKDLNKNIEDISLLSLDKNDKVTLFYKK